jgi:hypothetical protein
VYIYLIYYICLIYIIYIYIYIYHIDNEVRIVEEGSLPPLIAMLNSVKASLQLQVRHSLYFCASNAVQKYK